MSNPRREPVHMESVDAGASLFTQSVAYTLTDAEYDLVRETFTVAPPRTSFVVSVFKASVGPVFLVYFWLHVSHGDHTLPILLFGGFGIGYVAICLNSLVPRRKVALPAHRGELLFDQVGMRGTLDGVGLSVPWSRLKTIGYSNGFLIVRYGMRKAPIVIPKRCIQNVAAFWLFFDDHFTERRGLIRATGRTFLANMKP